MDSLVRALSNLRTWYKEHGNGMPYSAIVDATNLSESTVQRYLNPKNSINPSYENILAIASAIGMKASELEFSREIAEQMDKQQLTDVIVELRKMSLEELASTREADDARWRERLNQEKITHTNELSRLHQTHMEEMQRMKDEHTEEMKRCHEAHADHVLQIHQMYDKQMESMRSANSKQMELMLDGHARQIEAVQSLNQAQRDSMQSMSLAQKSADEKTKDFLQGEINQRDGRLKSMDKRDHVKNMIIFALIAMIFMLFFIDFMINDNGWIRRVTTRMFSYHYFG